MPKLFEFEYNLNSIETICNTLAKINEKLCNFFLKVSVIILRFRYNGKLDSFTNKESKRTSFPHLALNLCPQVLHS